MLQEERGERKKKEVDLSPMRNAILLLPWKQNLLVYP